MRLLVAGGGTGGHIYPALAVARSLSARPGAPELRWLGGRRGLEGDLVPAAGLRLDRLWLRSLRSVERDVHLVLDPARLVLSIPQAVALLLRWRPAAVFTTGGYVAIPTVLAARALRIPVLLWEGNVIPGRSGYAKYGATSIRCAQWLFAGSSPCVWQSSSTVASYVPRCSDALNVPTVSSSFTAPRTTTRPLPVARYSRIPSSPTTTPPPGKSGPRTYCISSVTGICGWSNSARQAESTSARLCAGMFVASPTAMPLEGLQTGGILAGR